MVGILSQLTRDMDAELTRRQLAYHNLADFFRYRLFRENRLRYTKWNWHIDYMAEILMACNRREILRLILNVPPRHFKSEMIQTFSAWMIGRDNSQRSSTVTASYTAGLAYTNSRKTLRMVKSNWFRDIFSQHLIQVDRDEEHDLDAGWMVIDRGDIALNKSAVKEWETNGGATFVACGVGGELTGKGGSMLLCDDPLKPLDANSELIREKTNAWLGETFESRLNDPEDGCIIHIAQRLHELDPCGYLIEQALDPQATQWHHVTIPLIAERRMIYTVPGSDFCHMRERGDLIDARRISPRRVEELKRTMKINFWGQYQQRPSKMEGAMLRPNRIIKVAKSPKKIAHELGLRPNFFIDLAVTEKETQKDDPDYSAILVGAKDSIGRVWLLEAWRGQLPLNRVAAVLWELWQRWKPFEAFCEKGAHLRSFRPFLEILAGQTGHRMVVRGVPLPQTGDGKVGRAHSFQALLDAGLVYAPEHQPWWPDFASELAAFPKGRHDDWVDDCSMLGLYVNDSIIGTPPPKTATVDAYGVPLITGADLEQQSSIARARHRR